MIKKSEIQEAVATVLAGRKKKHISKNDIVEIVECMLIRAGFWDVGGQVIKKGGVLGHYNRNMMLITREVDGYKFLPMCPDGNLELLVDNEWMPARIMVDDDPDAVCRQRLDVSEDIPVYGIQARVVMSLDGSGLPVLLPETEVAGVLERSKK
jgi:hypothetical protein